MGNGVNVQVMSIAQKWAGIWGNKQKLDSGYECGQVARELREKGIDLTSADQKALVEMGYVPMKGRLPKIPEKSGDFVTYDNHGSPKYHSNRGQYYRYGSRQLGGTFYEHIEQDPSGQFLTRKVKKGKGGTVTTEKFPISTIEKF